MSNPARIRIDRLSLTLHGVSRLVAEQAAEGLDAELQRRLGTFPSNRPLTLERGRIALQPVHIRGLDAAALRGAIADRLVDQISSLAGGKGGA